MVSFASRIEFQDVVIKAEFINSFLDSAVDVWERELSETLVLQEAEAATGTFETGGFTAAIKLHGRLTGDVFYELPDTTGNALVAQEATGGAVGNGQGLDAMQALVGKMSAAAATPSGN